MRRIYRVDLSPTTQQALDDRQAKSDGKFAAGALDVEKEWHGARHTRPLTTVLRTLRTMAGGSERCMYCHDSHGTDIEHFWPKTPYPERMFRWPNLLLCCTECGRFKGNRFPLHNGEPLLIDPSAEDPWKHLDFDPDTGNIVALYDTMADAPSRRGEMTVEILQLDRREALGKVYLKTWRRLRSLVEAALQAGVPEPEPLAEALREADDHGLLGWCFSGTGRNVEPFHSLRRNHQVVWDACAQAILGN